MRLTTGNCTFDYYSAFIQQGAVTVERCSLYSCISGYSLAELRTWPRTITSPISLGYLYLGFLSGVFVSSVPSHSLVSLGNPGDTWWLGLIATTVRRFVSLCKRFTVSFAGISDERTMEFTFRACVSLPDPSVPYTVSFILAMLFMFTNYQKHRQRPRFSGFLPKDYLMGFVSSSCGR